MRNLDHTCNEIEQDHPNPLLHRQVVTGDKILVAMVELERGCKVALHHHDSEQIANVIRGRVRWGIGEPGSSERKEFDMVGGQVLHLPSNLPHEVEALEDSRILDMLSPPGPMGVDSQGSAGA